MDKKHPRSPPRYVVENEEPLNAWSLTSTAQKYLLLLPIDEQSFPSSIIKRNFFDIKGDFVVIYRQIFVI